MNLIFSTSYIACNGKHKLWALNSYLAEQDSNSGLFDSYPSPLLLYTTVTWFLQAACLFTHTAILLHLNYTLCYMFATAAFSFLSSGLSLLFLNLSKTSLLYLYKSIPGITCYILPYLFFFFYLPQPRNSTLAVHPRRWVHLLTKRHALELSKQYYS